jgi:hypothetical protein
MKKLLTIAVVVVGLAMICLGTHPLSYDMVSNPVLLEQYLSSPEFPGDVLLKKDITVEGVIKSDGTYEPFTSNPVTAKIAGGAAGGTTGDENVMVLGDNVFEYHILGAGQTILAPSIIAGGLDISLDDNADEGVEIGQGITARSKQAYTVGTDACYLKVRFTIKDVDGTDDCAVGFRKAAAYQANIDDYTDMAVLNVISGAITIETIDDDGATSPTDTTDAWGDTETHTLEVYVDKAGAVTFKIDGAAPTVTASHTIDSGDVIVPFLYLLHHTNAAEETALVWWECAKRSAL